MQRTSRLHFFDRQDGKFRPNSAIILLIVFNREIAAMKRSKSVKLVAMGTGLLLVAACEEAKVDTALFESVKQCTSLGLSEQECVANFQQAQQTHIAAAPKYTSQADCEADFGAEKCDWHRSGRHPAAASSCADGGIHDGQHAVGRRPQPAFVSGRKQHQFPNRR